MLCSVQHRTIYRYTDPVQPCPHVVRLRPRADGALRELEYALRISPEPAEISECIDHEGNTVAQIRFAGETHELVIESTFRVETLRTNSDNYSLAADVRLDAPYSDVLRQNLASYLAPAGHAPAVAALAADLAAVSGGNLGGFLSTLNTWLHRSIKREIRESGNPRKPEHTLARGRGACRDLAVLFVELCRLSGIAARFVSGYQMRRGDRGHRYMHAWPEVYLPNAGWRGYDPTHGKPVADAHVAVAAAAAASDATPIEGAYFGAAASTMTVDLHIRVES